MYSSKNSIAFQAILLFISGCTSTPSPARQPFSPSIQSAEQNGPQIFNALHNAMRQFGSSLHHNGMSFFQAIIPTGTILYHGGYDDQIPVELEWLAFEIEHAENFARGRLARRSDGEEEIPFRDSDVSGQSPLQQGYVTALDRSTILTAPALRRGPLDDGWDPNDWTLDPGYLHTYQATRPLNVVYLDGMAAGKTSMGTNDAADFILSANRTRHIMDDFKRAADLCAWAKKWDIDGFLRMEPGFEIVYCNFRDGGLEQISATRRTSRIPALDGLKFQHFQWIRAASQRYHGIGGGRVIVDYSSMVSAFFYPLNLTNPNITTPELPRLLSATDAELAAIRRHVEDMTPRQRQGKLDHGIDWQAVTDMVVTRYAENLALMAATQCIEVMRRALVHLTDTHISHEVNGTNLDTARGKCASHELAGVVPETTVDLLIYAGIHTTTQLICQTLFDASKLFHSPHISSDRAFDDARLLIQGLMAKLQWSKWKECGRCEIDEVCFIAMWPYGNTEDHYQPSCQNISTTLGRGTYWDWEWDF